MSELFLTTGEPQPEKKRKPTSWEYTENVVAELVKLGYNKRTVEVACIDFRTKIYEGEHKKLSAADTALKMIDVLKEIYKVSLPE